MPTCFFRSTLLLCTGFFSLAAHGQTVVSLVPKAYNLTGSSLSVQLTDGVPGKPAPAQWKGLNVRWVFVRTGMVQENRDSVEEWLNPAGEFEPPLPASGPVVIGIDFKPVIETLPSLAVTKLLEGPGYTATPTVKVRHFRSAMTIVRKAPSGGEVPDSGVAVTEVSLASSIHPLMDPTTLMPGGEIAFEVTARGGEVEEAKVNVLNLTTGKNTLVRGGEGRACHFKPEPGCEYLLTCQWARKATGDPDVKFDLFSSSLTFRTPAQSEVTP